MGRNSQFWYIAWTDSKFFVHYITPQQNKIQRRATGQGRRTEGLRAEFVGVHCWTGDDVFYRSLVHVPAIICAYNNFINGVDKLDQFRSTAPTHRKKKLLQMSLFTWLLYLRIHNSYALRIAILSGSSSVDSLNFQEFKR